LSGLPPEHYESGRRLKDNSQQIADKMRLTMMMKDDLFFRIFCCPFRLSLRLIVDTVNHVGIAGKSIAASSLSLPLWMCERLGH
jgi:hypothetical protein